MNHLNKLFTSLALAGASLLAAPAYAFSISYDSQVAGDGSGLTSARIPAGNTGLLSGWYIETFDPATANPSFSAGLLESSDTAGIAVSNGCSVNSFGTLGITTTGGGLGVQSGSNNSGAAPAGNSTCYGFGPRPGGTLPATVKVDYSNLLVDGAKISYLGLYYGSIDTYNNINIYNGNELIRTITGQSVLEAQSGTTGDQFGVGSNVYVNFEFDPDETFTAFEFVTTGVAFEVDNIVVGLTNRASNVPEPGSLALLSAGLLGFAATRRKQRKS